MKDRLSVGIFIGGNFIPSYDGATNRMHYLSRHLQENGTKVVVFHGYRGWTDLKLIAQESFKTFIFPIDRYYRDIDFLASFVKKERIHIVQFNDLESIITQGIKLSQATGTYVVSESYYVVSRLAKSIGASAERIRSIRKLEVAAGKAIDHVIALSDEDKPELQKTIGVSSARISVVMSGVDLKEIKYWGSNFDAKTILFLGNLYFEPNAEAVRIMYLQMLPPLRKYGFRFLIVGDYPPYMEKRYHNSNFIFTGPVRDLNDVFRRTTAAVAPVREGTGLRIKILNYLGAGLPVITTSAAASGIRNKNYLIIEEDFRKYPDAILNLVVHRDRTIRLASRNRRFAKRNFNWHAMALQAMTVYRKILSRSIRDKSQFIDLASRLCIDQPAWLEEAERKKRFAKFKSTIRGDFSYGVLGQGKMHIVK